MRRLFISLIALVPLAAMESGAMPVRQSLGMFESGATSSIRSKADTLRGGSGEVSRFQILPSVWHRYTRSRSYDNPEVAWAVAERILADRTREFRAGTGRPPTALELYLLWNKPGHFAAAGYAESRVKPEYRERAQRFSNLFLLR